jgi:hypothetical protein
MLSPERCAAIPLSPPLPLSPTTPSRTMSWPFRPFLLPHAQICVAFGKEPSWQNAMALILQDSFLARLSLLSPATLSPEAWGVMAKLMDGAIDSYSGLCSIPAVVYVAKVLKQLVVDYAVANRITKKCACRAVPLGTGLGWGGGGDCGPPFLTSPCCSCLSAAEVNVHLLYCCPSARVCSGCGARGSACGQ